MVRNNYSVFWLQISSLSEMICNRTRYKSPRVYAFQEFVLGSPPFWSRNLHDWRWCAHRIGWVIGPPESLGRGVEWCVKWKTQPRARREVRAAAGRLRRAWGAEMSHTGVWSRLGAARGRLRLHERLYASSLSQHISLISWLRVVTINSLYLNVKHESEKIIWTTWVKGLPLTSTFKSYLERQRKKRRD